MSTMGGSIIREPEPSMGGWVLHEGSTTSQPLGTLYTEPRPSRAEAERISREREELRRRAAAQHARRSGARS